MKTFKAHLWTIKPLPDQCFCLKVCIFGGKVDLLFINSGLVLGWCLIECNLDFISVFVVYRK